MNYMDLSLEGRNAVITGGTDGIGFEIAKAFSMQGCQTAIIGRNAEKGRKAQDAINDICGRSLCSFYKCDVANFNEVQKTCESILTIFNFADILVLNAGIEFTEAVNEIRQQNWEKVMNVNVGGAFYFINVLSGSMIENEKGNIIILGSVAARTGAGGGMHYAASKAALKGISARINYELLPKGVRSNIISPGMVDTPMLRKKYPDEPKTNKMLSSQVPLGRIGRTSDIANLALFLASDASEYICGQDILIDGGRLMHRKPVNK